VPAEPLYTLLGQAPELAFAVLENIRVIATRHPRMFAAEHRLFFCRYAPLLAVTWSLSRVGGGRVSEPLYCKQAKLAILTEITTDATYREIITELWYGRAAVLRPGPHRPLSLCVRQ
jgi:hypothetical protein